MFEQQSLFSIKQDSFSVTQISAKIKHSIENDDSLQNVWIKGEISNVSQPKSGHLYFTLKDAQASLRCVMWRSQVVRQIQMPKDGEAVEVKGSVTVYEKGGQYQLNATIIRPAGEGKLYQEFLQTKNKLEAEGLFDPSHKRAIPVIPKTIGIVTSPSGAALQDMLNTIQRRFPLAKVILSPATVQGSHAPAELVDAIKKLNQEIKPDVILIGRGGGSLEDLWCFNDEAVARAIFESQAPIISGVGHETDFVIADFVADLRAPTPTAAAELATPDQFEYKMQLDAIQLFLENYIMEKISTYQNNLSESLRLLNSFSPLKLLTLHKQHILVAKQELIKISNQKQTQLKQSLIYASDKLALLNPDNTLKRGYAIVYTESKKPIISIENVTIDDEIQIKLHDGKLTTTVINKEK